MFAGLPAIETTLRTARAGGRLDSLWGDGFADDGFATLASVDSWDTVCVDEYVRLFPKLVGRQSRSVVEQLECNVKSATSNQSPFAGTLPSDEVTLGKLLGLLHGGRRPDFEPSIADTIAFLGAIHPAYFWPEAVVIHQRYSTLGWLGIVMRGRPALMPFDVAEYLVEVIETDGGMAFDEPLFKRIACRRAAYNLRGLALLRLAGRRVIVWPDCLRARRPSLLGRYWKRRLS